MNDVVTILIFVAARRTEPVMDWTVWVPALGVLVPCVLLGAMIRFAHKSRFGGRP